MFLAPFRFVDGLADHPSKKYGFGVISRLVLDGYVSDISMIAWIKCLGHVYSLIPEGLGSGRYTEGRYIGDVRDKSAPTGRGFVVSQEARGGATFLRMCAVGFW